MPRAKPTTLVDWTPVMVRPCICGGVIAANPRNPYEIERRVWAHQRSYPHRAWWARSGWAQVDPLACEMVDTGG